MMNTRIIVGAGIVLAGVVAICVEKYLSKKISEKAMEDVINILEKDGTLNKVKKILEEKEEVDK